MRLYGWCPSGNGIKPYSVNPSGTADIGVVRPSTQGGYEYLGPGAMMCAMYVISGSDANGWTWVPLQISWLK